MRYRPAPGLISPRQTPQAGPSRECARFTALALFASISCVDMLAGLDVLMVSGADDGRRTRGRAAVIGAARSEGRQRGQHYAHSCGEERHCLHRRGCVSSHRPTSGESFRSVYLHDSRQSGAARRPRKCCDCGPSGLGAEAQDGQAARPVRASYRGDSSVSVQSCGVASSCCSLASASRAACCTAYQGLGAQPAPACAVSECSSAPLDTGRYQITPSQFAVAVRAARRFWLDGISTEGA